MEPSSLMKAISRLNDFGKVTAPLQGADQDEAMRTLHDSIGMTQEVFDTLGDLIWAADLGGVSKGVAFTYTCFGVALALSAVQYEADQAVLGKAQATEQRCRGTRS